MEGFIRESSPQTEKQLHMGIYQVDSGASQGEKEVNFYFIHDKAKTQLN